jgi:hypothetical protein
LWLRSACWCLNTRPCSHTQLASSCWGCMTRSGGLAGLQLSQHLPQLSAYSQPHARSCNACSQLVAKDETGDADFFRGRRVIGALAGRRVTDRVDDRDDLLRIASQHQWDVWLPSGAGTYALGNSCFTLASAQDNSSSSGNGSTGSTGGGSTSGDNRPQAGGRQQATSAQHPCGAGPPFLGLSAHTQLLRRVPSVVPRRCTTPARILRPTTNRSAVFRLRLGVLV